MAQAVALQPGVSRSGVTMTAGRLLKLNRADAARFSFLLALPITAGAGVYKGIDVLQSGFQGYASEFFWGFVASGVSGFVVIAWLLRVPADARLHRLPLVPGRGGGAGPRPDRDGILLGDGLIVGPGRSARASPESDFPDVEVGGLEQLDQPGSDRLGDRFALRMGPELLEAALHVVPHGVTTDLEPLGDLGGGHALGHEMQDSISRGVSNEVVRSRRRRRGSNRAIVAGSTSASPPCTVRMAATSSSTDWP